MLKFYHDWFKFMKNGKFKQYEKEYDYYKKNNENTMYNLGSPVNDYQKGYQKAFYDNNTKRYLTSNKIMLKLFKYNQSKRYKKSDEYNRGYDDFIKDTVK
ncbi:hypothetical protein MOO46_03850 [Apilactobacillus apisilvae]|uniref:Uncharacterized protein n=1 Tax=Apilactobacillus apisilvae TaxID=2923364 RepID=A0ABY4PFN5_9LACO|nr:hypothetical protein [Apilactobacillus apisilvae]UQS84397.1 hypothetical protein MOO46_03850 [Apilactobacillus apisilvae]